MFLIQKYTQYKAAQAEQQKRKVTEKELAQLNHKIDKLLTKLDEHEPEIAVNQDEECVVCVTAKATMQTYPCGHRVVCRKCFVKTIQMAVAQRLLPLRCVICRAKILRLKHSTGSVQSLPVSASQYTIGHNWYSVPQSASLYSVTSNTSAASGTSASSASSCSSSASYKTCASSFSSASFRKSHSSYNKLGYKPLRTTSPSPSRSPQTRSSLAMAIAKKDNRVAPAESQVPLKGKLSLIQEFRREFSQGKEQSAMSKDHIRDPKLKLHKGNSSSNSNQGMMSSGSSSSSSINTTASTSTRSTKSSSARGGISTEALDGGNSSCASFPSISKSHGGKRDGAKASSSTSLAAKSSKENLLPSRSRSASGSAVMSAKTSHTPKKRLSLETPSTTEKLSGASPIKSSFSFLSGSSLMASLNLTPKRKTSKSSSSTSSIDKGHSSSSPPASSAVVIPKLAPPPTHTQPGTSSGFRLALSRCGRSKLKDAKGDKNKHQVHPLPPPAPEEQPLVVISDSSTASSPK